MGLLTKRRETVEEIYQRNVAEKVEHERLMNEGSLRAIAAAQRAQEAALRESEQRRKAGQRKATQDHEAEERRKREAQQAQQQARTSKHAELQGKLDEAKRVLGEARSAVNDAPTTREAAFALSFELGASELVKRARAAVEAQAGR